MIRNKEAALSRDVLQPSPQMKAKILNRRAECLSVLYGGDVVSSQSRLLLIQNVSCL